MSEIASAYVSLIPSARGFGRATSAQINPQVSRSGALAGGVLGKSMLKGFIAIGAAVKITQFLGDSVAEAREANKVAALTNNVIKTTGGVAKVSAIQVNRLADALSRKTGIDDEQIATSENMLLTFKNVSRQGDGLRNVFARATRAAVDLSASGFGDIIGTTKQLGKALNDPIKGLTALGRSGVTFSAQQIERVKKLVTENKLFKAQGIILREVESQVKGAAEAQATNSDKARVALGNLKEQIGQSLIPAVDALSGLFANKIAPALSSFITGLQNGTGAGGQFASFINNYLRPVFEGLVSFFQNYWLPAFRDALPKVLEGARVAFERVRKAVADNKPELQQLFNAAKKIADVFFTKVLPAIYTIAGVGLKRLGTALSVTIAIIAVGVRSFNAIREAISTVHKVLGVLVAGFGAMAVAVRQKVSNVVTTVKGVPGKIQVAFAGAITILLGAGKAIIQGLINGITAKLGELKSKLEDVSGFIKDHKGPPAKDKLLLVGAGELIMDGLIAGIQSREKKLGDALGKVSDKISKKVKEQAAKIRDSLASVRSDFASLVEPIASNFTQSLFDFDTAGAFTANLATVKGTLTTLIGNFKKLIGEGLNPGFLYQLFQSGGPALINSLAGLDAASAQSAGSLFGDVQSLSDQLGTAVAGSTDKGAALEGQTVRLEKKLDKLIKAVHDSGDKTKEAVTQPAKHARRRAVRA